MSLADRLRANATLLDQLVRADDYRYGVPKRDLRSLVADLLQQAAETEELEALAGRVMKEAA